RSGSCETSPLWRFEYRIGEHFIVLHRPAIGDACRFNGFPGRRKMPKTAPPFRWSTRIDPAFEPCLKSRPGRPDFKSSAGSPHRTALFTFGLIRARHGRDLAWASPA